MKRVSVIIVNWNGKDATLDCIESLLRQDYPELEIIVSDNGSTDGSLEIFRKDYPQVRLVENGENLGFGSAVNKGIEIAKGDYFLFLNNDLVLKEDAVATLAKALNEDRSVGAVIPKILYVERPDTLNSFGVLVHFTGMCYPKLINCKDSSDLKPLETACGGIFMFRKIVFECVGGFDSNLFLYHEDHDLSWRIRLGGWVLRVIPQAIIFHHYQFDKGIFKFYSSEKNRLFLLLKNLEWKTLFLIFPALILVEIAQVVHSLLNGWFKLKLKSYIELVGLFPIIFRKRRILQKSRKISDAEIVRLYEGDLRVSGVKSLLLEKLLSPILSFYWRFIRLLI